MVDVLLLLHLAGQHPLRPQQGHQDVLDTESLLLEGWEEEREKGRACK